MNSKIKILSVLGSAIALSVACVAVYPALSQSTSPTPATEGRQMRRANFLNLTEAQQTQMRQIRQNERSQIEAVLTADQRAQLQRERAAHRAARDNNQGTPPRPQEEQGRRRAPFESLNLTADQRTRIEAIVRASREQRDALLTPEQRQLLQERRQQRQENRQQSSTNPSTPAPN